MSFLPCGCGRCGCLCEIHSPDGTEHICNRHITVIVARWIAGEIAALIALCLLVASAAVWAQIFSQP